MRWSKVFKRNGEKGTSALDRVDKVVVFGGGSFGTAMGTALARQRGDLQVTLLLRDPYICNDITVKHINTRYLKVVIYRLSRCSHGRNSLNAEERNFHVLILTNIAMLLA